MKMPMWKSNETHIPGRTLLHFLADNTRPADRYEFANNCKSRSDPFTGSPDPLSVDKWPVAQLLSCLSIPQVMRYLRDVSNTPIIQPPSNAHYGRKRLSLGQVTRSKNSGRFFFFLGVRLCEEINASMNKTCENIGKMRQVKFCRRICSLMFDSAKSCEMYLYIDKIIIENLDLMFEIDCLL